MANLSKFSRVLQGFSIGGTFAAAKRGAGKRKATSLLLLFAAATLGVTFQYARKTPPAAKIIQKAATPAKAKSGATTGNSVATKTGAKAGPGKTELLMTFDKDHPDGEIVVNHNSLMQRPIASLTKLMTIRLTLKALRDKKISLSQRVTISRHAAHVGKIRAGLRAGQKESIEKLMGITLLFSGNDAATALAEGVAGSEAAFVKMMNAEARAMGLKSLVFYNASGLPARHGGKHVENKGNARDLISLRRSLDAFPEFHDLKKLRTVTFGKRVLHGHSALACIENTDLKTGYTRWAGAAVLAHTKLDDKDIYIMVAGFPKPGAGLNRDIRAAQLLDKVFTEKKSPLRDHLRSSAACRVFKNRLAL